MSPYGLGLSSEQSWDLSPREFQELSEIHYQQSRRWAIERAMFANAYFKGPEEPQYTPEDFLGLTNYQERRIAAQKQKVIDDREYRREMARVAAPIKLEEVPDWAR